MVTSRDFIGKTVNEGDPAEALIIEAKEEFLGNGFIVLCILRNRKEFVTWWMNEDMKTFHGHYYLHLGDAWEEFKSR